MFETLSRSLMTPLVISEYLCRIIEDEVILMGMSMKIHPIWTNGSIVPCTRRIMSHNNYAIIVFEYVKQPLIDILKNLHILRMICHYHVIDAYIFSEAVVWIPLLKTCTAEYNRIKLGTSL